jgi:meso-butanediol dehydrogenase/(S,S)-butanediol dehydrogenase/diacetyl reductase
MEDFNNKIVAVTGAASGLGRATAIAFAERGATLALIDRDEAGLQKLVGELGSYDIPEPYYLSADLSQRDVCLEFIESAVKQLGGLDVLCNIAGVLGANRLSDVSEAQWNLVMGVNLAAPFWLSQTAMPHLIERGGNIVNVASSGALKGEAYLIAYTATKAALVQMTRSMAMEFMKENVRINSVSPGAMVTNIMSEEDFPADADGELIGRFMGMRPPAEPEAVADLIVYVASDRAGNIHGANLSSDGGVSAD